MIANWAYLGMTPYQPTAEGDRSRFLLKRTSETPEPWMMRTTAMADEATFNVAN